MERDCEITFKNLTAAEVKTLADAFMSLRLHPTASSIDAVNYSAPPRDARTGQVEVTDRLNPPPVMGNVPPPPPVAAPAAAPSTGQSPATASTAPRDARGVPFDERYHSGTAAEPGVNDKGAWKKRRNHDPVALAAYEAQFLGKSQAGGAIGASGTSFPAGAATPIADAGNAAPAHQAAPPPPTNGMAPPTIGASGGSPLPPPPPPGTPGLQDFQNLWLTLVNMQVASPALENYMVSTYGGHPVHSDAYSHDPAKRLEAYQFLKRYLPAQA
jgi:hypothetical protein